MKINSTIKVAVASILLCIGINGTAQNQSVSISDFKPLEGRWSGTLTYLDYSSNTNETIKTNVEVSIKNATVFEMGIFYTDEPNKNEKDKYRIRKNGTMINKRKLIERTLLPDGTLKIVLQDKGTDGNDYKPATFHHVLLISKNKFTMTKLVKFDGEINFFQRNQYSFRR
jgi:hypothetical protein